LIRTERGRHVDAQAKFHSRAIHRLKPTPRYVLRRTMAFLTLWHWLCGSWRSKKLSSHAHKRSKTNETDAFNKPTAMMTRAQVQALFGGITNRCIAVLPALSGYPNSAGYRCNLKVAIRLFWDRMRKIRAIFNQDCPQISRRRKQRSALLSNLRPMSFSFLTVGPFAPASP